MLDDRVKSDIDNPSIGLILCKDKNKVVAEYALKDMTKPIGVSEYKLMNVLPDELFEWKKIEIGKLNEEEMLNYWWGEFNNLLIMNIQREQFSPALSNNSL